MDRLVRFPVFTQVLAYLRLICLSLALVSALPAWSADAAPQVPININSATAEQLSEGLKGIGPSRAEAIVEYRKAHGKFARVEDLLLVKGVGQRVLDDNRDRLSVNP